MNHKRVVYNEVMVDKQQIEHIADFLRLALRHKQKIPRKFRVIIEEQVITPVDSKTP